MFGYRLRNARKNMNLTLDELAEKYNIKFDGKLSKGTLSKYENEKQEPMISVVNNLATLLNVSVDYLIGKRDDDDIFQSKFPSPNITEDYTTFPVIGEIAAGWEGYMTEPDWEGETVDIPNSYLKGRPREDFFVLRVKGDSMYPLYHEDDKVLIYKQSSLDYSGQIGAIVFEDDHITLKKVEFIPGEDWLRMIAINPVYPPKRIENEDLEQCRVLGIPKLLLRDIE